MSERKRIGKKVIPVRGLSLLKIKRFPFKFQRKNVLSVFQNDKVTLTFSLFLPLFSLIHVLRIASTSKYHSFYYQIIYFK